MAIRNVESQRRHQQLIASKAAAAQERSLRQSKILEKVWHMCSFLKRNMFQLTMR